MTRLQRKEREKKMEPNQIVLKNETSNKRETIIIKKPERMVRAKYHLT